MTDIRVPLQCDGCGQVDDHPHHHYGSLTFHFDCTPYFVVQDYTSVSDHVWDADAKAWVLHRRDPIPGDSLHPMVRQFLLTRQAALDGVHGSDLVAKIADHFEEHAPHTDDDGVAAHLEAVAAITREQHDVRPDHLQFAAQFPEE